MRNERLLEMIVHSIRSTTKAEESELRELGQGVFFMPELAFSYRVGKTVARALQGDPDYGAVKWRREERVDGSGPCDLLLVDGADVQCAVEFKLGGTSDSYLADIMKLRKMSGVPLKLFCALVDALPRKQSDDERITYLKACEASRLRPITPWETLETTLANGSCRSCVVAVWQVLD